MVFPGFETLNLGTKDRPTQEKIDGWLTHLPRYCNCLSMPLLSELLAREELKNLSKRHLLRTISPLQSVDRGTVEVSHRRLIDFCSNDYLGLSQHPVLKERASEALERWGCGARASRLMSGDLEIHHALEDQIARLKGTEAALVFGSGYLANIGAISSIVGRGDGIFMDRLCHASMVDGALLSKARIHRFQHNDMDHLESLLKAHRGKHERAIILVESLYSMDGDIAPVEELIHLKNEYEAILLLDEAHAVGALGKTGEGLVPRSLAREIDIHIGTFGKAFGSYGAFCAVSSDLRSFFINRARSFIFSTALPPAVSGANLAAIEVAEEYHEGRNRLHGLSLWLRKAIEMRLGLWTPGLFHIIPIIIGENQKAVSLAEHLLKKGFLVRAIRPPTVPEGQARLRISLTTNHSTGDLEDLVETLADGISKAS